MQNKKIVIVIASILISIAFNSNTFGEVKNIKVRNGLSIEGFKRSFPPESEIKEKLDIIGQEDVLEEVEYFFPSRNRVFMALEDIFKDDKQIMVRRIAAARLMGELGITSNVSILVENLLLGYKGSVEFKELNARNFPVGFALIKIGANSYVRLNLLNKIKNSYDDEMIRLCAFVLMKIEDKDVAGFILKREIDKEKDDKKKANLEKALSFLE
ncbi:MAG: hypothetical protein V1747_11155 [Candidatus Omnitrophota bacterium]